MMAIDGEDTAQPDAPAQQRNQNPEGGAGPSGSQAASDRRPDEASSDSPKAGNAGAAGRARVGKNSPSASPDQGAGSEAPAAKRGGRKPREAAADAGGDGRRRSARVAAPANDTGAEAGGQAPAEQGGRTAGRPVAARGKTATAEAPDMPKRRQPRSATPASAREGRTRAPAARAANAERMPAAAKAKRGGKRTSAGESAGEAPAAASARNKEAAASKTTTRTQVAKRRDTAPMRSDGDKADKKRWSPFSAYTKQAERLLVRMRPEKLVTAQDVVKEIEKGPQGPKVIAAFDFDGTLVGGLTGAMLMQERMRRKEVSRAELAETAGVTFRAMAKLIEANEVVAHSMAQWAGKTENEMEELGAHLFENKIQDAVFPEMRQILDAHRAAGHTIVVATSASSYQVEPTVKSLGIDHLLCTRVEVAEGKLTGKLVGDSLFGAGKVAAIKEFIAEHGSTLADTYFYGDGDEEVGLMEAVGYPHPTNPGRRLCEAARAKGWPIMRLQSRGSAKPAHFLRGVAGMMTIMPILQAGLAVGLLSRDKRSMANMVMPTWIQTQLDLAGVKLRVSGRKNLWARRPAVFIFNHRNNFDGSFVAALVRTDYVSIAKKDMAKNPVGKLVAAIMPTVFIDRGGGDASKAAETLQPVVEAVDKGYSIMLAPEGTRVVGNPGSVGPFKKGAFHMAMAAGIPVVPVVIRNALDVAGRDSGAMRPGTVDIAVLPPISVEDWDRDNLNEKVEEVRQLYMETLQNFPEPDDDEVEE